MFALQEISFEKRCLVIDEMSGQAMSYQVCPTINVPFVKIWLKNPDLRK